MNTVKLMNIFGKAFLQGVTGEIIPFLGEDCECSSDYSCKAVIGAHNIIEWMKSVNPYSDGSCRYTYEVVELRKLMKEDKTVNDWNRSKGVHVAEHGLLLFQHGDEKPVAVVCVMLDDNTETIRKMDAYIEDCGKVQYTKTHDRRVLGQMKDFDISISWEIDNHLPSNELNLVSLNHWIGHRLMCGSLNYANPIDLLRNEFEEVYGCLNYI